MKSAFVLICEDDETAEEKEDDHSFLSKTEENVDSLGDAKEVGGMMGDNIAGCEGTCGVQRDAEPFSNFGTSHWSPLSEDNAGADVIERTHP